MPGDSFSDPYLHYPFLFMGRPSKAKFGVKAPVKPRPLKSNHISESLSIQPVDASLASQKEYEYRQLFELAPIGYFIFDEQSIIHDVNLTGIKMLQTARRRVLHKPFMRYLSQEDRHQFTQHLQHVIETEEQQACDLCLQRQDGTSFYVEMQSVPIDTSNHDDVRVRSAIIDITVRRQMEEELIAEREKALQAVRFMNEFLANMSHEIRTPLAGVIGFAEVLEEELPAEHREIAQLIASGGNRLLHTLNSVLDFAKLKAHSHRLLLTPMNVVERVQKQCRLLSSLANQKNLKLTFESESDLLLARLDPSSLDRILNNLIGNAIKYTETGEIKVRVDTEEKAIVVRVEDTGIGINPTFLPHIFEPFRQEYMGDDRPYEGVGLGLTITKRLVDLMHGTIDIESRPGEGSRFSIYFPQISQNEELAEPIEHASFDENDAVDIPRYRILVVEDNLETQLLVKRMLKTSCDITFVDSFDAGVAAYTSATFDVLLLDINLGEKRTGTDLLHKLRALPGGEDFYAVAFTAYALPTDRAHFLTQGFDDYLPKPFAKSDLLDLLQRAGRVQASG